MQKGYFKLVVLAVLSGILALAACKKFAKGHVKVTTARYHHESGPSDMTDTVKVKRAKKVK